MGASGKLKTSGRSCFVIMPFSETLPQHTEEYWCDHFENFIKPAVENARLGFRCERSRATTTNIVRDIMHNLHKAYVVLADITDWNPNVMYELGVRHALRTRTILIAEEGTKIPFDLEQYGVLFYESSPTKKGIKEFSDGIRERLQKILDNPDELDNPVQDWLHPARKIRSAGRDVEPIVDGRDLAESDVHIKAMKIMEGYDIGVVELNRLCYQGYDENIYFHDFNLGTPKRAQRQIRLALLESVRQAISSGEFGFEVEEVREMCKAWSCYDSSNFQAAFRRARELFESYSPKQSWLILSQKGRERAFEVIKQITS